MYCHDYDWERNQIWGDSRNELRYKKGIGKGYE